jgi:hypothetical protein
MAISSPVAWYSICLAFRKIFACVDDDDEEEELDVDEYDYTPQGAKISDP